MVPDRPSQSFAEAEGRPKYPGILGWGEIDQRLRSAIWNVFWILFDGNVKEYDSSYDTYYDDPLHDILLREFVHRQYGFANEFVESFVGKEKCWPAPGFVDTHLS